MIGRMRNNIARRTSTVGTRHKKKILSYAAAIAIGSLLLASCVTATSGDAMREGDPLPATSASPTDSSAPGNHITEPATPPDSTAPEPDGSGWPSSGTPENLQRFYQQTLDWGGCAPYARTSDDDMTYRSERIECARLTVPLDYAAPEGETITIGVLRSSASGDRLGSVLFNPGGPGASGMSIVALIAQYGINPALAERFDLIGFDPRGVGASEPHIACQTDAERDADRARNWQGFMPSSTPEEVAAANQASQDFVNACLETISEQGVDGQAFLAQVGTVNVAQDMDILRAVLGDEKLTYVGWSYGTSIGTQYAEQFPENVRAMLLDGALDPTLDAATDSINQAKGFQGAFEDFAVWCADRNGCLWDNAADANEEFSRHTIPLMDTPLALKDGRTLSFLDAITGVANALYSDFAWPDLLAALEQFAAGRGELLMNLADEYYDRDAAGRYGNMLEAFTAIRCMDTNRVTDPEEVIQLNKDLIAATPFQNNGQPAAEIYDVCAFWPAEPTLLPHVPKAQGLPTVVVMSTVGDPATPHQAGVDLAEALGARLVTIDGTRHGAYMLAGVQCADNIGNDYLINLTLPAPDARC